MACFALRGAAGAVTLLFLCAASPVAWAQPTPPRDEKPPPGEYRPLPARNDEPDVRIDLSPDRPGLSYRVSSAEDNAARPPDTCDGSCTLFLAPGDYRFELFDHGRPAGSGTVDVKYDAVWRVKPQNRALKWVGLGAFVAGAGAAWTGVTLLTLGLMGEGQAQSHRLYVPIGLGLGVAGALLMPLGWHWFWANRSPVYDSEKIDKDAWIRRIRVGALPAPGGASFAASWSF